MKHGRIDCRNVKNIFGDTAHLGKLVRVPINELLRRVCCIAPQEPWNIQDVPNHTFGLRRISGNDLRIDNDGRLSLGVMQIDRVLPELRGEEVRMT